MTTSKDPDGDMPEPFDNHNGTHDDCTICDGILAKRMIDMGVEPEWKTEGIVVPNKVWRIARPILWALNKLGLRSDPYFKGPKNA